MTSENSPSKAEYIIQQLNATNAKKVAFLLVFGFICYHGLIHLRYGMCVHNIINTYMQTADPRFSISFVVLSNLN